MKGPAYHKRKPEKEVDASLAVRVFKEQMRELTKMLKRFDTNKAAGKWINPRKTNREGRK